MRLVITCVYCSAMFCATLLLFVVYQTVTTATFYGVPPSHQNIVSDLLQKLSCKTMIYRTSLHLLREIQWKFDIVYLRRIDYLQHPHDVAPIQVYDAT